jgi:hypothetical protein
MRRHANLDKQFIWTNHGRENAGKELGRVDLSRAVWASDHESGVRSERAGGPVRGWIRVHETPAEGASMAHLDVCDMVRDG